MLFVENGRKYGQGQEGVDIELFSSNDRPHKVNLINNCRQWGCLGNFGCNTNSCNVSELVLLLHVKILDRLSGEWQCKQKSRSNLKTKIV